MKDPDNQNRAWQINQDHSNFDDEQKSSKNLEFLETGQTQTSLQKNTLRSIFQTNKQKLFKRFFILILVITVSILCFQELQTYGHGPSNKPGKITPSIQKRASQKKVPNEAQNQLTEQHAMKKQKAQIQEECYKKEILGRSVFFVSFDIEQLPQNQRVQFQRMNIICKFTVINQLSFDYYVDLWNLREEQVRYNQEFINYTNLTKDQKRILLIWFRLYFWSGIYVHPSFGVNFGKHINDIYLIHAYVAKQLLFAKIDYENEKGYFVPERSFKTVKVGSRFSEYVRKIILKLVAKEDWMEICENFQCTIIKNGLKESQEL